MLPPEATTGAIQIAAAATGAASLVTTVTEPTVPGLGVALSVLLAANAGALIGLAYAKPEKWRVFTDVRGDTAGQSAAKLAARTFVLAFTLEAIAVTAAWVVTIAPHLPWFGWTASLPPMPTAGLLAAGGQFLFPAAMAAGKRYFDSKWGVQP